MRPVERIDETVELLRAVWHDNPDMRLGQLLCNVVRDKGAGGHDPFYVEDDEMAELLRCRPSW
jgi:uncharacterized protein YihD (DUF1040 family)